MKNVLKSKLFAISFLFAITFAFIFLTAIFISKELQYSLDWKQAAEAAAAISLFMVAVRFQKHKSREYENIEQGSSKWGTAKESKKLVDCDFCNNIILSSSLFLSMDMFRTRKNCHVFVVGGSGAGKSKFYATPNIMQMNASYVITDPGKDHLSNLGKMLEDNGYKIKVFNVVDMTESMHFNPFAYFKSTEDILRFINILIANTGGGGNQNQNKDDFWSNAEKLWFMAHIAYIRETCQEEEQTLNSLVLLLTSSEVHEEDESFKSAVDVLFDELEQQDAESFAVKQYKKYKLAAGKTAKSILISVGVRLAYFDIPALSRLVADDDLELNTLGDEKTALFIVVNDHDPTYNFLVTILLDMLFNTLTDAADHQPSHHLKIPVRCILDEIANIGFFPNMHILIAVLRRRWVSLEFLFQNLNQLKAQYKDNWATIEGNCDTTVFLGGKGEDTTKYVSNDLLGKATIDTVSYGHGGTANSMGPNSYNSNEQKSGRNLLDETEVSRLKDDECIVSIRGLNPYHCKKYLPKYHPNYRQTADCNPANAYTFQPGIVTKDSDIHYVTVDLNKQEVE